MMKFVKYFVVFMTVFASCKANKNLMNTPVEIREMSARKVARKHMASNFEKTSIEAKLKASFNNGKLKQRISISLKMKKDEVIWLKGTKFITLFKAKITPTSVRYYSSYAKNYFEGDFTILKKILGTEINFNQLQNLLLGQSLTNVKEQKQQVFIEDKSYVLSPKRQEGLFDIFYSVNPSHFKLDKQSIVNSKKNQRLDISYLSYGLFEEQIFPKVIEIKALQPGVFTNIDFILKAVQFDTDLDLSFSIPNGYKQIKL
jgi:hypothetical protein